MVKITGRKIESNPDEVVIKMTDGSYAFPKQISALETKTQIKPEEYALVQEGDSADRAISMKQRNFGKSGKNHLDTNVEVLKSGLVVPRVSRLVTQIINVNLALAGKGVLYDASGKLIEGEKLRDYANTINHKCWVWGNESFEKGEGFLDLNVVYITGLEDGEPVFKREHLLTCLDRDCYADLESVNEQGFPTEKSPVQEYKLGKSVYFWHPRANRAARFGAGPVGASFGCYWDPRGTYAVLGVRHVREAPRAEK